MYLPWLRGCVIVPECVRPLDARDAGLRRRFDVEVIVLPKGKPQRVVYLQKSRVAKWNASLAHAHNMYPECLCIRPMLPVISAR